MPALTKAVAVELLRESQEGATFTGALDGDWVTGSVPHGGYSLSCVINAAQAFVRLPSRARKDAHVDPFHVAATYIAAAQCKEYECEVKVLKNGRGFTNLQVELKQVSSKTNTLTTRILVHIIMTNFSARSADPALSVPGLNITRESPYHAVVPLAPPERCSAPRRFAEGMAGMKGDLTLKEDLEIRQRAKKLGSIMWGAWANVNGEDEARVVEPGQGNNMLALFADMAEALPLVYLRLQEEPMQVRWYPTMHLVIEFKRALPFTTPLLRAGIALKGRFISYGQAENDVELWSHADDAELLGEAKGSGSHILAISRQTALSMSVAINEQLGTGKKEAKL